MGEVDDGFFEWMPIMDTQRIERERLKEEIRTKNGVTTWGISPKTNGIGMSTNTVGVNSSVAGYHKPSIQQSQSMHPDSSQAMSPTSFPMSPIGQMSSNREYQQRPSVASPQIRASDYDKRMEMQGRTYESPILPSPYNNHPNSTRPQQMQTNHSKATPQATSGSTNYKNATKNYSAKPNTSKPIKKWWQRLFKCCSSDTDSRL
jgi:hypothetical protein